MGNVYSVVGLCFDMVGALLLAIDVVGESNAIRLKNYLDKSMHSRIGFIYDEELKKRNRAETEKLVRDINDRIKRDDFKETWLLIKRNWHRASPSLRWLAYRGIAKIILLLLAKLAGKAALDLFFFIPYYWASEAQKRIGIRVLPCLGLMLLVVGFALQIYGL